MKLTPLVFAFLGFTIINSALAETHNHKAHVHGAAKLTLALETETSGTIDLDCAADSIVGFEYEAKTKKDQNTRDQAFQKLRDHASSVLIFNPELACTVTATKVEMEKEESKAEAPVAESMHGQHSDVNASFKFSCKKKLSGSTLQVGLIALFPKLKSVSLQILSDTTQTESIVKNEHDPVTVP
jgi:hypothetical protein